MTRPGDLYRPQLGDYLGDMTDELDGGHIVEFVAAGPKQYAFRCISPDGSEWLSVKLRGITLTDAASKRLNFKSLKRLVGEFLIYHTSSNIVVTFDQLRRTGDGVVTSGTTKRYRVVYDKCRVLPNSVCVPFGFRC